MCLAFSELLSHSLYEVKHLLSQQHRPSPALTWWPCRAPLTRLSLLSFWPWWSWQPSGSNWARGTDLSWNPWKCSERKLAGSQDTVRSERLQQPRKQRKGTQWCKGGEMQQCRSCLAGLTSQSGLCFSSSFNPTRKKHGPMHKTLPKRSAG